MFVKKILKNPAIASILAIFKIFFQNIVRFDIDQRATSVAYSFLLAIFPGIIFLFTLIPYVPVQHIDTKIMDFLATTVPFGLFEVAQDTVQEIVSHRRGDILSFGFFLAIYSATSGMVSLMRAFNMTIEKKENRNFIKTRFIATLLTFLLVLLLLIAIIVLVIAQFFIGKILSLDILNPNLMYLGVQTGRYIGVFLVFFSIISCIYWFAPNMRHKFNFFNIGSLLASILVILVTNVFSWYLSNFASYNKIYGSIGTLIALMIWLYLVALIIISGFDLNVSIRQNSTKNATAT